MNKWALFEITSYVLCAILIIVGVVIYFLNQ